jgi:hypothetical protein
MVLFMINLVYAEDKKFPMTHKRENIRIGSHSGVQVNVDEVSNRIKIGKCEVKTDPSIGGSSFYCDFLRGMEGKVFNHYVDFENKTGSSIYLSRIVAKDQVVVKVNGKTVFSSTGSDNLSLNYTKFTDLIVDEPFDFYYGINIRGKVEPIQTAKVISVNPSVNITPLLKSGSNRIEVQTAVGYLGGYEIHLSFSGRNEKETYNCSDTTHSCSQGKSNRIWDGVLVERPCWQYSYSKTCQYPSKNDCGRFENDPECYFIQDRECILRDSSGNCVNVLKEYSCHRGEEEYTVMRPKYISQNNDSNIPGGVQCSGLPCFEGLCGKNEWDKDEDMLKSTSKLSAAKHAKGTKDINNISLFAGIEEHCSIRIASSSNCCKIKGEGKTLKGWSHKLGAKCTKDEIELVNKRMKDLCVYVGNKVDKTAGVRTLKKEYYCCFSSQLFKQIQVQGRQQLGMNFGSGSSPNCRGLNLNELQRIDFNKINFEKAFPELIDKLKIPDVKDIGNRVQKNMPKKSNIHGDRPSQMKRPKNKGAIDSNMGNTPSSGSKRNDENLYK